MELYPVGLKIAETSAMVERKKYIWPGSYVSLLEGRLNLDCSMYEKKNDLLRAMLWRWSSAVLLGKTGLMLISLMSGLWETTSSGIWKECLTTGL